MYHVSGRPMHHVSFYTVSCLLTIVYHLHPSCHRHNNDLDQDHQRTNIILPNILKATFLLMTFLYWNLICNSLHAIVYEKLSS